MTGFTPPPSSTDPDRRHPGPAMHAGASPRTEPTVDGVSNPHDTPQVNPAYEQFQREYAERYAQYEQPNVPRRRLPRLAYMAMVFVVGAGVGLGSAWWVGHQSSPKAQSVPGISSSKPLLPPLAEARKLTTPGYGTGVRGISRSELPYDGAPPPDVADDLPGATPPLASANSQRASPVVDSSGNTVDEVDVPSSTSLRSSIPASAESATASPRNSPPSQVAKPAAPDDAAPDERDAPLAMASKEETQPVKSDPKPSVVPPKRKVESKVAKDLEIERIRQQADEELKKKNEAKRRVEEARVAKKSNGSGSSGSSGSGGSSNSNIASARSGGDGVLSKVQATQVMLARCERASNIFAREQCKWKLCNGMWGRNGCPSYSKPAGNNAY